MGLRDRIKGALGLGAHTHLTEGAAAPALDIPDATGKVWKLQDLRGKPAVIYFYPKDDTPGCTKEACNFRDQLTKLNGATVLGISSDDAKSHAAFTQKFNLNFPLLSDPRGEVAVRYGVSEGKNPRRVTFVIDREGRIAKVWDPVSVSGHADAVREAVADLP